MTSSRRQGFVSTPPVHHVALWQCPCRIDDEGPLERWCGQFLDETERASAARYRVASARNQHVVGRGMTRCLLAGNDHDPTEIEFKTLPHGKPIVAHPLKARRSFNIAHTRGLVISAMGADVESGHWLGVDVETIDRRTDAALAKRYFAKEEVAQIESTASETSRQHLFLKIWTLKEAFIKAIGTGLQTPLDQFAFLDADSDQPRLKLNNPALAHGRHWSVRSVQPRDGFVAAVAIGTPVVDGVGSLQVAVHQWDETAF